MLPSYLLMHATIPCFFPCRWTSWNPTEAEAINCLKGVFQKLRQSCVECVLPCHKGPARADAPGRLSSVFPTYHFLWCSSSLSHCESMGMRPYSKAKSEAPQPEPTLAIYKCLQMITVGVVYYFSTWQSHRLIKRLWYPWKMCRSHTCQY